MPDEKNKSKQGIELATPRFFAAPNLDSLKDHPVVGPHVNSNWRSKKRKKKRGKKKMRYAAYVRISSEDQIGNYSIDAQKRAIEAWVVTNGGILWPAIKITNQWLQSIRRQKVNRISCGLLTVYSVRNKCG